MLSEGIRTALETQLNTTLKYDFFLVAFIEKHKTNALLMFWFPNDRYHESASRVYRIFCLFAFFMFSMTNKCHTLLQKWDYYLHPNRYLSQVGRWAGSNWDNRDNSDNPATILQKKIWLLLIVIMSIIITLLKTFLLPSNFIYLIIFFTKFILV